MRLKAEEAHAINAAAREAFGPDVVVRLFGSRVHDHLRGGDIDLLVEVAPGADTIRHEARFLDRLFERIDEQKIDLVLHVRGREMAPFARFVARDAVTLP